MPPRGPFLYLTDSASCQADTAGAGLAHCCCIIDSATLAALLPRGESSDEATYAAASSAMGAKRHRSRSPSGAAPRRSRRLLPPSCIHLVTSDPDPDAQHITALRQRVRARRGVPRCPNRSNPYHECSAFCVENWAQLAGSADADAGSDASSSGIEPGDSWTIVDSHGHWTVKQPPPTCLEAALRRLALAMLTLSEGNAGILVDPAFDLVEMICQRVVGYDHWVEAANLEEFGESAYRTRTVFAPVPSLWGAGADEETRETLGWFKGGLKTLEAGFLFEGDVSVDIDNDSPGYCNGLYTVIGERKGCPVLYCAPTGVFCFRAGSADFEIENQRGWLFTLDDPRDFIHSGHAYAELINEQGDPALIVSDFRTVLMRKTVHHFRVLY